MRLKSFLIFLLALTEASLCFAGLLNRKNEHSGYRCDLSIAKVGENTFEIKTRNYLLEPKSPPDLVDDQSGVRLILPGKHLGVTVGGADEKPVLSVNLSRPEDGGLMTLSLQSLVEPNQTKTHPLLLDGGIHRLEAPAYFDSELSEETHHRLDKFVRALGGREGWQPEHLVVQRKPKEAYGRDLVEGPNHSFEPDEFEKTWTGYSAEDFLTMGPGEKRRKSSDEFIKLFHQLTGTAYRWADADFQNKYQVHFWHTRGAIGTIHSPYDFVVLEIFDRERNVLTAFSFTTNRPQPRMRPPHPGRRNR